MTDPEPSPSPDRSPSPSHIPSPSLSPSPSPNQAAVRRRNARRQRQLRELKARNGEISHVISELDLVISGLDLRKAQVDAHESDAEAAAVVVVGGQRGDAGNDPLPLPPPPHTAEAAEAALTELALGDTRVVELAPHSPRAPATPRGDDGAPRATGSSRKARQLPGWMYERIGEAEGV